MLLVLLGKKRNNRPKPDLDAGKCLDPRLFFLRRRIMGAVFTFDESSAFTEMEGAEIWKTTN
jgi:hypothetical protein